VTGPPDEPRHPILAKLIVICLLALLKAATSRTHPLLWPILIYGWAAATTGSLLALWRAEERAPRRLAGVGIPLLVRLYLLPGMGRVVGELAVHRARRIRLVRADQARHPELAAKVRQQLQRGRGI
jgi:hypothetical protein